MLCGWKAMVREIMRATQHFLSSQPILCRIPSYQQHSISSSSYQHSLSSHSSISLFLMRLKVSSNRCAIRSWGGKSSVGGQCGVPLRLSVCLSLPRITSFQATLFVLLLPNYSFALSSRPGSHAPPKLSSSSPSVPLLPCLALPRPPEGISLLFVGRSPL